MFTRSHYEKVAQIIRGSDPYCNLSKNPCGKEYCCPLVERLIRAFREDNPNFDENKFRKKCA